MKPITKNQLISTINAYLVRAEKEMAFTLSQPKHDAWLLVAEVLDDILKGKKPYAPKGENK